MADFKILSLPDTQEEGILGSGLRNVVGGLARAGETVLGLPADIAQTGLSLAESGLSKLTGQDISLRPPSPEQIRELVPGLPDDFEVAQGLPLSEAPAPSSFLPTSQNIRELVTDPTLEAITGEPGYADPQSRAAEIGQNVVEDLTSLMTPLGPLKGIGIGKSLALAGLGNVASELTKEIGFGEGAQVGAKLGTMMLTSFLGRSPFIGKHTERLYNAARESIPEEALTDARSLRKRLSDVTKRFARRDFQGKELVDARIDNLLGRITEGNSINVHGLMDAKKDINTWWSKLPGGGNSTAREYLGKTLDAVKGSLDDVAKEYPHFNREALKSADELFGALRQNSLISKIMGKQQFNNPVVRGLMGLGGVGSFLRSPLNTLKSGVPAAIGGTLDYIQALGRTPAGWKLYKDILKNAGKQSSEVLIRKAHKLDDIITKANPAMQSFKVLSIPGQ